MKEPCFNLNQDCVEYCKKDVDVLMKSVLKFVSQAFQFQDLLHQRYGPSPDVRKRSMPYFHPFFNQTTLGSYRYVYWRVAALAVQAFGRQVGGYPARDRARAPKPVTGALASLAYAPPEWPG